MSLWEAISLASTSAVSFLAKATSVWAPTTLTLSASRAVCKWRSSSFNLHVSSLTHNFIRIGIFKLTKQQKYQQVLFQTISLSLGVVQLPQQMLFAVIT
jgi:hypothetical protein